MPEHRLERTRNPKMEIAPCIRLGHEWSYRQSTDDRVCIRCRLVDGSSWLLPVPQWLSEQMRRDLEFDRTAMAGMTKTLGKSR